MILLILCCWVATARDEAGLVRLHDNWMFIGYLEYVDDAQQTAAEGRGTYILYLDYPSIYIALLIMSTTGKTELQGHE